MVFHILKFVRKKYCIFYKKSHSIHEIQSKGINKYNVTNHKTSNENKSLLIINKN